MFDLEVEVGVEGHVADRSHMSQRSRCVYCVAALVLISVSAEAGRLFLMHDNTVSRFVS